MHAAAVEVIGLNRKSPRKNIWWNEKVEGPVQGNKEEYID